MDGATGLTEPEGGDGRLLHDLGALLDLVLRLAHLALLLLSELRIAASLLKSLRLVTLASS